MRLPIRNGWSIFAVLLCRVTQPVGWTGLNSREMHQPLSKSFNRRFAINTSRWMTQILRGISYVLSAKKVA